MTDDEWIAAMRQEAIEECERCQGRRHADCDSACRFYFAQTQQEVRPTPWTGMAAEKRGWLGATFHGLEEVYAE